MPNIIYEFAKLRHSIISSYDYINMELNLIEIGSKFPAKNIISQNDSQKHLIDTYEKLLKKFNISEEIIKIVGPVYFYL